MKPVLKTLATCLVVLAAVAVALATVVAINLRSYARLTYEQPVAEIEFQARAPQRFVAVLTRLPNGESQSFELAGDQWQVDARVLKWQGWANLIGLDAQYRLDRVSGRYLDIEQEKTAPRSVYELYVPPAIDLWAFAEAHPSWFPFVDGMYGSATFLPMAEGAQYEVTLTQSGLIARPKNDVARALYPNAD